MIEVNLYVVDTSFCFDLNSFFHHDQLCIQKG